MTNFTRKFLDEFAKDNKNTDLTVYGSTASGSSITSSDPEILQSNPKFREGWKGATLENLTNNTRNPVRNEWSALDYIHNYHINHILQKGGQEYDDQTEYFIDDLVRDVGSSKYYQSIINNNVGNPLTDDSKWKFTGDIKSQPNVVLVKEESDFGVAVGNEITLQNENIYRVTGKVPITKKLIFPDRSKILIEGGSYAGMDELIIVANVGDFLSTNGQGGILHIFNLNITDATATNKLINSTGDGSFTEQSIFIMVGCNLTNFFSFGNLNGYFTVVLRRFFCFETGSLSLDNVAALTVNAFLWKNFTTKGKMFDIRTNLSQAALTEVSLLPAKGDEPLNVDPAIINESGISITLFPYNGFVFVNAVDFADNGVGGTTITSAIGHSFDNNDYIFILGSAYAGVHQISNVINKQADVTWGSVGKFDIPVAFAGNDLTRPFVYLFDIGLSKRYEQPFYSQGLTGSISSIANNGSGFARVNSIGHGRTTGDSLYISNTDAYDGGYYVIVIDVNNFDLLDGFGQPVPFTTPEIAGNWDTSSLDQTNNVISAVNTGGIIPDSQTLGNNILTSTIAFASTTTLTRVSTGNWFSDEAQRFKPTSDGRLIYIGRTPATVTLSAKVIATKQSGTASSAFVNFMIDVGGTGSFVEIPNHPSTEGEILSSRANTFALTAVIESISPGDVLAIGFATDSNFTVDISAIDLNVIK